VAACPEGAIGASLQVDAARCAGHRRCVAACETIGAIDFSRTERGRSEQFDLVLDLRDRPAFAHHQLPQGYFHPGADPQAQFSAAMAAQRLVGEFEKPKFFRFREKLCAHRRNEITGCTRCIDVCSAQAIRSGGDRIAVEPHLCVGCGACATVCPSGAMGYAYPTPAHLGARLKAGLAAWRAAGGASGAGAPMVLFHDGDAGRSILESIGRARGPSVARGARAPRVAGLPARVVPVELHHVAAVGIDVGLAALAFGASQVAVLLTGSEAPQYVAALREQFDVAQRIVSALGYSGAHFHLVESSSAGSLEEALYGTAPAAGVDEAATFALSDEKRRSIEFAVDHLATQARRARRTVPESVALPDGAPFGALRIDTTTCTLCLACTGACPESALLDNPERPQLRFIEANCVQCGLCVKTCPEDALALEPRLRFDTTETRSPRVLNEAQPFNCVSCGKAFGTRQMIDSMIGKLSGHSMFGGDAMRRLQMCADCRVTDMFTRPDEASIFDVTRRPG
jgi:Fe-S-cluster-containing hydrogenase component 2